MFFDGHAETLLLNKIDVGWPNSIGMRLRYFATTTPDLF